MQNVFLLICNILFKNLLILLGLRIIQVHIYSSYPTLYFNYVDLHHYTANPFYPHYRKLEVCSNIAHDKVYAYCSF